jgi:hypothetical protein
MCKTKFSRKKVRGYQRKILQLEKWKNKVLSFTITDLTFRGGLIFRPNFFYPSAAINPPIKLLPPLYKALLEILSELKSSEKIVQSNLIPQIWLFYPRINRSHVRIVSREKGNELLMAFGSKMAKAAPQWPISKFSSGEILYVGSDIIFKSQNPFQNDTKWSKIKMGDIWVAE